MLWPRLCSNCVAFMSLTSISRSRRGAVPHPLPSSTHRTSFYAPNLGRILRDGSIAGKLAGAGHVQDALSRPLARVAIEFTQSLLRLEIRRQVREVHVVVSMGQQRFPQRLEDAGLVAAEMIGEDQVQRG